MFRAVLILGALAACDVGEVPIGGGTVDAGGGGANAASFQQMITPLVMARGCLPGAGACHAVQPPILTSFDAMGPTYKVKPGTTNILVTKGAISTPVDMHSGAPYFNTAEQATVANWIESITP